MDNVLSAETWLFGEVGQAYYHQDDQYFKVSVRDETPTPCRAQEMNVLYDACMDAPIYLPYILPPEQLSEKLWEWYEKYSALEFFLDGLDATLDEELRINCIRDVEETFEENEEAYQFVRQRFLSRPLLDEADVTNAIKYANTLKVKQLYQEALRESSFAKQVQDTFTRLKFHYTPEGLVVLTLTLTLTLQDPVNLPKSRKAHSTVEDTLKLQDMLKNKAQKLHQDSYISFDQLNEEQSDLLTKQNSNSTIPKLKDYFNQSPIIKKS